MTRVILPPEGLREFYEKTEFILPPDSQFRQFCFGFENYRIRPIRKTIRTVEDLRKFCLKVLPLSIYCSRAKFLQARSVTRICAPLEKNLFLSGDLVFDFDSESESDRATSFYYGKLACAFLKTKYSNHPYFLTDSGRGFHFWLFDFYPIELKAGSHPRERYSHFKGLLKKELDFFKFKGIDFCESSYNPRQVFRVVGSWNFKVGKPCELLYAFGAGISKIPELRTSEGSFSQ